MPAEKVMKLDDCTEFGLTLRAKPPAIVHGAALLLTALVAGAIIWAATTRVSLVVRANGQVRAVNTTFKVSCVANPEALNGGTGPMVRTVHYHQGQIVNKGDVLVVLESGRLEETIAQKTQTIAANEKELGELRNSLPLMEVKFRTERRKALAELRREQERIDVEKKKQAAERKFAEIDLRVCIDAQERLRPLVLKGIVSRDDWDKVRAKTLADTERLEKAKLPIPEDGVIALQEAVKLVDDRHTQDKHDLEMRCNTKQAQIDADQIERKKLNALLPHAVLRAGETGLVTSEEVQPGTRLDPSKPVVEIAVQLGYDFEAEISTEDRVQLSLDMPAKIKMNGMDFQQFGTLDGTIVKIPPDAEMRPAQPGTQRPIYPVRIRLQSHTLEHDGKTLSVTMGLTGTADIVTGEDTLLGVVVKRIRQAISLE